jgi:DNA-directed RNA polymerase specialized sigma subunit
LKRKGEQTVPDEKYDRWDELDIDNEDIPKPSKNNSKNANKSRKIFRSKISLDYMGEELVYKINKDIYTQAEIDDDENKIIETSKIDYKKMRLTRKQKLVLDLYFSGELKQKEIASILGISQGECI